MKNIYKFCLLIQLISTSAFSQVNEKDNGSIKAKEFSSDSASISNYEFAKISPFYLKKLMPAQFSKITFGYNYDKGTFMPAQGASKLKETYLNTEGSTAINTVDIWGMFSYRKTLEDSTQYNHQTRNNISSPYYFGSPINVSYERAIYNLKALAEKNIIDNNLPIGLGADYRVGSHFSTNDPRGSIADYQFNLIATLGYTFFDKLKIGGAYRYGYGQERFNVAYKNNSFSQNNLRPEYNNYLINGYGEAYVKNSERNYNNDQSRNGVDAYINFDSNNAGSFIFNYFFVKEKQKYLISNSSGISNFNTYYLENNRFNLLWLKNFQDKKLSVDINYLNTDGKDFNYVYLANNYVYNYNQLSIKNILTIKKSGFIYNYNLGANRNGEQRKDGLTGNDIKFYRIDFNAGFGFTKQNENAHFFGFNINALYTLPVSDNFNVTEANIGIFTKTVIYRDYLYNTSKRLGGTATFNYSMPTFNNIQTEIKLGVSYQNMVDVKDFHTPTGLGKDRFFSNISLNLYF